VVFRRIAGSDWPLCLGVSWGNVFTVCFISVTVLGKEHMLQYILRLCMHFWIYMFEHWEAN